MNKIKQRLKLLTVFLSGAVRVARLNSPRALFPMLRDYFRIRRELNDHLSDIVKAYRVDNPGASFEKYLDIDYWLWECLGRYYRLGLDRHDRALKVLDLGTGAGFFPYVCRYYGHDVECLDVPDVSMYNDIIKALGLHRYEQRILFDEPLVCSEKYDLITAFMICFNKHKRPDLWHIREWSQFIDRLMQENVVESGTIFLGLNSESKAEPAKPDLLQYFSDRGAIVRGIEVLLHQT